MTMKKILFALLTGWMAISFTACDDFLTETPSTSVPTEEALVTTQDFQNALNGVYYTLGSYRFLGRDVLAIGDAPTDITSHSVATSHFYDIFRYQILDTNSYIEEIWAYGYWAIDRCARIIKEGASFKEVTKGDLTEVEGCIAQAYAIKALCSFYLTNMFGLPYSEANKTTLGIVNVTEPVPAYSQVSRVSVEQNYSLILDDITKAKEYYAKEGVENVDEILDIADGIMVARGDLGVEVPAEDVPLIQKSIIKKCKQRGKIVITATQMLESMQQNPRPTRAEVSDVANAIYDGTDAIMLSGESASGLYPQEAVLMMSKIAHKIESSLDYQSLQRQAIRTAPDDTSEAICMSVAEIAYKFNVAAIIAFTESGFTARKMARYRTKSRIIAATPSLKTVKALALNWGVKAVPCKQLNSRISMIDYASIIARENGVKPGQKILVTGGTPGVKGATSYLELVEVK